MASTTTEELSYLTIAYQTDEMIFSFAFKHILDFIPAKELFVM
jgi:hypothetical protein